MVYRQDAAAIRHADHRLRLGPAGTDDVLARHQTRCSHYDAFRFFTDPARPAERVAADLGRSGRPGTAGLPARVDGRVQVGVPVAAGGAQRLVVDAFEFARAIREVDMRASPYDLTDLGLAPIRVETAAGKAQYVAAQRGFAERAQTLRRRLLGVLTPLAPGAVS